MQAGGVTSCRSQWGEESAESALGAPATSAPVPLFIPLEALPPPPTQARAPEVPLPPPTPHPPQLETLKQKGRQDD